MAVLVDVLHIACLAVGATVLYSAVMAGLWALAVRLVRACRRIARPAPPAIRSNLPPGSNGTPRGR